ncbi:GTP-binding protein [bacterium]|nr:GTP-binding protein [bacterium]
MPVTRCATIGKASFKYAWVLDETDEERSRGVTVDVATKHFETEAALFTLLDAPGHRDFIPNMISGVAQADCGMLVVNTSEGEYETGLLKGGQTREHATLLYTGGIANLVVAMNKMDCCGWDRARYDALVASMSEFLASVHFKVRDSTVVTKRGITKTIPKRVTFVPCSGLSGENLAARAPDGKLASWYTGPTLLEALDSLAVRGVRRDEGSALCVVVNDVYRSQALGLTLSGKLERGSVQPGDKVLVLPGNGDDVAVVKGLHVHGKAVAAAFVGDVVEMGARHAPAPYSATLAAAIYALRCSPTLHHNFPGLTGIDEVMVRKGSVACDPEDPVAVVTKLRATIQVARRRAYYAATRVRYVRLQSTAAPVGTTAFAGLGGGSAWRWHTMSDPW